MEKNEIKQFEQERIERIKRYSTDIPFQKLSRSWLETSMKHNYVYNFEWLGRPIIQYPQDIVAIQELVWKVKPDLIIETGIAHGGSLILSASLLSLLDLFEAIEQGVSFNPRISSRKVIGIDIDIRAHNRKAIESHPLASRIKMIEGSSIAPEIIENVHLAAVGYKNVMVFLDSMHTHNHVLAELNGYAPLVSEESYCVVFDTFVEDMPPNFFKNRPWNVGDNPKTAVIDWLQSHSAFKIDRELETKLQVTVAPHGFLQRKTSFKT